jgi:G patch domain-containing protein 1
VFDYLSKEDRERIEHAAAGLQPSAPDSTPPGPSVEVPPVPSSLPYIAPQIAAAALKGFMPFANDLAKRERYVTYLRSQATPDHPELLPPKLPGQTSEAYHRELSDYSKSAAIFKPVSGAMANRFTTAAVVDLGPTAVEGLHQPTHAPETALVPHGEEGEQEKEAPQREVEEVQSSKAHAARTGMYGSLTREITPWQPSRLLCKRFGVKDPNPDITTDTPMPGASRNQPPSTTGGDTWKAEDALAEADLQTATGSAAIAGPSSAAGHRAPRDLENIGLGEDESQGRDTLTYVRPSMDIFKAIFASDDEDDEDENGGGEPEEGGGDDKSVPTTSQALTAPTQVHDATVETSTMTYEPKSADRPPADPGTVDIATFKPIFVPRAERGTQKSKNKDKTDVRGKDKKRVKPIVSFEDDGEEAAFVIAPQADKDKTRKKKKRRKEEEKGATNLVGAGKDEDTEMWIEKAPPQVVASFVDAPPAAEGGVQKEGASAPPPTLSPTQGLQRTEGPPRGRKRATDFL